MNEMNVDDSNKKSRELHDLCKSINKLFYVDFDISIY